MMDLLMRVKSSITRKMASDWRLTPWGTPSRGVSRLTKELVRENNGTRRVNLFLKGNF
jgi:hypothetical protein